MDFGDWSLRQRNFWRSATYEAGCNCNPARSFRFHCIESVSWNEASTRPSFLAEPWNAELAFSSSKSFVTYDGHVAKFFSELFQNISTGFVGKVKVESQERISLVVVRLQSTSSGVQLTTLSTEPSDR